MINKKVLIFFSLFNPPHYKQIELLKKILKQIKLNFVNIVIFQKKLVIKNLVLVPYLYRKLMVNNLLQEAKINYQYANSVKIN